MCRTDRDRDTVALMLWMGLRACEVAGLTVADYDPDAATVFIVGKADHERILPVPVEAAAIIDRYIDGRTAGPLVRTQRGAQMAPHTVSCYVSRLFSAAGLKRGPYDGVSGHALRHTALSDIYANCLDLRVVQAVAGHVHLSSTEIYLRRADLPQMREAMAGRGYGALTAQVGP